VIKRGAVIGIGTVLLVIGLGGLALLQTGVIYPPASIGPVNLSEGKPAEPAPQSAQAPQPAPRGGQPSVSTNQAPQRPVPVPHLGSGERRYPGQSRIDQRPSAREEPAVGRNQRRFAGKAERRSYALKARSESYAKKSHRASAVKPVVIRFRFDPVRDRELYVARVHSGDKIKVDVQQVGAVGGRVYVTYTSNFHPQEGVLVRVGTRSPAYMRAGNDPYGHGYYVIELTIYPGNRWNIRPRSFV
jgi:hypothetical protein